MRASIKRLLAAAAFSVLVLSSLHLYNYLTTAEWLAVEEIQLEGVCRINPAVLETLLDDIRGQNILLISLDRYTQRIAGHPRIREATIRRVLPNRVVCRVEEREPVALIFAGRFFEVDAYGMVLGEDDLSQVLDLPIITGISKDDASEGRICKDARLQDALETLEYCKRFGGRFAQDISELKVGTGGITIVSLKENSTLLLGDSDYENRLKKYFLLRDSITEQEQSAKVIDLRFEDQVVFRNKI